MNTFLWIITAIGLGVGLAMDACAVSMSNGLANPKMKISKICLIAGFFGVFQILMPIIGYLSVTLLSNALGESFTTIFSYLVPWIALTLLLILGIKIFISFASVFIGKKFGTIFENKATIAGGIILCAIGLEIFFTHWSDVVNGLNTLFNLF